MTLLYPYRAIRRTQVEFALMACDPDVALLNFFHAVDETSLAAWQSGVVLPDGTHRASFAQVKDAILANQSCHGKSAEWRHTDRVVGARATYTFLDANTLIVRDGSLLGGFQITPVANGFSLRTLSPEARESDRLTTQILFESGPFLRVP